MKREVNLDPYPIISRISHYDYQTLENYTSVIFDCDFFGLSSPHDARTIRAKKNNSFLIIAKISFMRQKFSFNESMILTFQSK